MVSQLPSLEMEDFVAAKLYCPCALADGNYHTQIREMMQEFCSTVLATPSLYLIYTFQNNTKTRNVDQCPT